MLTYADLIERITLWAEAEADVCAAFIIGSRARSDHPADEWSDLDVLVFAQDADRLVKDASWVTTLAPCWLTFIDRAGDGSTLERRTLFEGGLDVDVAFFTETMLDGILAGGIPADIGDVIRRGVRTLVDKDGKLAKLLAMSLPEATLFRKPTAREFQNETTDFWYHALWAAKHLRRGELWWAISCVDMKFKWLLGNMLEWHAHATRGDSTDTWLRGRFLEEWADSRAVEKLHTAFAHYDAGDIARALRGTMELYRWLEDETAASWGYEVPREGEQQAERSTLLVLEPLV